MAEGAARVVEVPPERLARWFVNFAERNGGPAPVTATAGGLNAVAPNGVTADCVAPFAGGWDAGSARVRPDPVAALAAHAAAERRVAVLLVRLGGYAVGVFEGETLTASKVGSRHVQGRSAAGGWSQQRFARRRSQQADQAFAAAADTAARILLPAVAGLDALVLGGERRGVDRVLEDRRLAPVAALPTEPRFLTVPDPRLDVLRSTPPMFRAIRISISSPPDARPASHPPDL